MLPINPTQIPILYKKAMVHQGKGELNDALKLYTTILNTNSKIAEAHFQTARIYLTRLEFENSVHSFAKAIALKPQEPAIWNGYCEALLRLDIGRETTKALKTLAATKLSKQAKTTISQRLSGRNKNTKVNLGGINPADIQAIMKLRAAAKPDQVEKRTRALIRKLPNIALLYNILAESLHHQSKIEDADVAYKKSLSLDPNYAEGHSNYGGFLQATGQADAAIKHLETARSSIPGSAQTLYSLAHAYFDTERFDLSLATVDMAIKADPKHPEHFLLRGKLLAKDKKYSAAITAFKKCQSLGDTSVDLLIHIARALGNMDDEKGAIATIDQAFEINPNAASAYEALGFILQSFGKFDQADTAFRKLLEIAPDAGEQFRIFSASHKFTVDDPLITHMQSRFENQALSDDARAGFAFALSKAMQDTKQYDQVFSYLDVANQLVRKQHPYDIKIRRDEINNVQKAFADFDLSKLTPKTASNYAPIFVTGMPRSGTTLIEQIIASHSTVTGAGEVGWLPRRCLELISKTDGTIVPVANIASSEITAMASAYQNAMQDLLPGAGKITDKSIQTYLLMGLVWLALPKAKIIVVRRDPRDNLLSIYRNVFPTGTHLYSYDLHDLGVYYRMFEEMIDFWRAIAPERFIEVWYDDLIENPEAESRKLIKACGLEWEDNCLNFHQNKRRVDTLSVYQVRQPIYKSSLKAWERYKDHLLPLFDALEGT